MVESHRLQRRVLALGHRGTSTSLGVDTGWIVLYAGVGVARGGGLGKGIVSSPGGLPIPWSGVIVLVVEPMLTEHTKISPH